jgi:ABC-type proline/glycine betaine transport system permease subunit
MPIAKRTLPFLDTLTRPQKRRLKVLSVGVAYVAGLALVTMAQITVDRMSTDVGPDQTQVATLGK